MANLLWKPLTYFFFPKISFRKNINKEDKKNHYKVGTTELRMSLCGRVYD